MEGQETTDLGTQIYNDDVDPKVENEIHSDSKVETGSHDVSIIFVNVICEDIELNYVLFAMKSIS